MIEPNVLAVIPFGVLLLSIAILPVLAGHWWEKHYAKLALALGSTTTIYYLAVLRDAARLETVAVEYVGFITLIGSLYVVASGIHIQLASRATPLRNTGLLAFGLQQLSLETPADMTHMLGNPGLARYVVAVSLGAVFFGASTLIGNGPNFMVKGIAERAGVKCPSFLGYIVKFSLPILLPLFAVVAWLFLR